MQKKSENFHALLFIKLEKPIFSAFRGSSKTLTHLFPIHHYGFLMFSGGRERVHWEQMGLKNCHQKHVHISSLYATENLQKNSLH